MIARYLHHLTAMIQQLGYAKASAQFYAGFFVVAIVIVAILMGAHSIMQVMEWDPVTGRSTGACGQCPSRSCSPLLLIHR